MIVQLALHLIEDIRRIKTGEGLKNDPLGIQQEGD